MADNKIIPYNELNLFNVNKTPTPQTVWGKSYWKFEITFHLNQKYSITDKKCWVKNKRYYIYDFVYFVYQKYYTIAKIVAENVTMIVTIVQTKNCNPSSLTVDRTWFQIWGSTIQNNNDMVVTAKSTKEKERKYKKYSPLN